MSQSHPENSLEKSVLKSDIALKKAFESLPRELRFHDIVESYFKNLNSEATLNSEAAWDIDEMNRKKYEIVQNSIGQLWENARKYADFLEYTKDFEPLLKDLGLRDHFIHSFNVFLLGYYIINKINSLNPTENRIELNESNCNLVWMLTSTFHDVAYAVEKTDEWLNKFFRNFLGVDPHFSLKINEILTPVYTDFMRMLSQYHKRQRMTNPFDFSFDNMDWYYYNELCQELAKKNHGVLSALMLCHKMAIREGFLGPPPDTDGDRASRNQWDFLLHLRASHAISLHNISSVPFVKFQQHPFAFVLILCDEIQDWGRGYTEEQKECIFLKQIDIRGTAVAPEIHFDVDATKGRICALANTLNFRLKSDSVKIFVNNNNIEDLNEDSFF